MSEKSPPTLRREIVAWYSVVLLVALGVSTLITYLILQGALVRTARATLRQTADVAEQVLVPQIPRIRTEDRLMRVHLPPNPDRPVEVLHRTVELVTGDSLSLDVIRNEDTEAQALRTFVLISLLLIPLTALAAALGGRILLERLLDPLSRLVSATREIGIGGLSRRVAEPDRPAELVELARSFNGMLMRLERAVETLSNFTADASHELRTPLTSIQGTVQVALARERSAAELQETLGEVVEETEWMLHLVDGLLILARGEEMEVRAEREPVDLSALLADVVEVGEALAAGKPVDVALDASAGLVVPGSARQLRQVFLNLVSNAVKFTEEGRVTVRAARDDAHDAVEVRVADTGIGIAPEELPRIFDRFYRGDAARSRPGGTGLGLAIARLLVEQHGGSIEVRSDPGRGSEFVVRLPGAAPVPA